MEKVIFSGSKNAAKEKLEIVFSAPVQGEAGGRGMWGKFREWGPIRKYIVDFVCHEKRIVIEIDGGQHALNKDYDHDREKWLEEQGYKVLRFWNHEVLTNMDGVLEVIRASCMNTLPFIPSHRGRGNDNTRYPQKREWKNGVESMIDSIDSSISD